MYTMASYKHDFGQTIQPMQKALALTAPSLLIYIPKLPPRCRCDYRRHEAQVERGNSISSK